jgi:hypothetical protein
MNKLKLLILALFFASFSSHAQKPFELGGEYLMPMGKGFRNTIAGARGESFNNKNSFSIGLTYHFSSAKSYSTSKGFGIYAGYRYSFSNDVNGNSPFLGARVLIHMENFDGKTNLNSFFITPFAEAGYHFMFAKSFYAAPSVGYGYSIKLTKEYNSLDEDVGKRFIPSLSAGYRF